MKKKKLEMDYSYDFELLGITTVAKGYRVAWEINKYLNLHLKKESDLVVKEGELANSYSYFVHQAVFNVLRVFKNRSNESDQTKHFLAPEHNHFDYIIMIQGQELNSKRLQKELKAIPSIELVAFIPLDSLKSKDHFIF
jgi:hypothetical protein